jgi:hypothetical protein
MKRALSEPVEREHRYGLTLYFLWEGAGEDGEAI